MPKVRMKQCTQAYIPNIKICPTIHRGPLLLYKCIRTRMQSLQFGRGSEIANDSRLVGPKNVSESYATVPSPSLALIAYQAHSVQRLQEKSSYCGRRKHWVWHTVLHGTGSLNPQIHSKPSVPEPAFIHAAPRHNLYRQISQIRL